MIGPATVPVLGREFSVDVLKRTMDLAEIDRAMVFHTIAREHDPRSGNLKLMELISKEPRLLPVWVLLPHDTGETPPPGEFVESMVDAGVFLARAFPKDHSFSFSEWGCGPLLSALEGRRIPLMIDLGQIDYNGVATACETHPDLPILLSDVAYRSDRFIYPLLASFPNLYIETSRYQVHRGIEAICRRFGSTRLVFGSRSPELACGPMAMTIRYASMGEDEKANILGGNLERLMEAVLR